MPICRLQLHSTVTSCELWALLIPNLVSIAVDQIPLLCKNVDSNAVPRRSLDVIRVCKMNVLAYMLYKRDKVRHLFKTNVLSDRRLFYSLLHVSEDRAGKSSALHSPKPTPSPHFPVN